MTKTNFTKVLTGFKEAINSYPQLYKQTIEQLAKKSSMESLVEYIVKCFSFLSPREAKLLPEYPSDYLRWNSNVRKAIDYYVLTKDSAPTRKKLETELKEKSVIKYQKEFLLVPYLCLEKYKAEGLRKVLKRCGAKQWSPACDKAIDFVEKHKVTLNDVSFEIHYKGWKGNPKKENCDRIYESLASRGQFQRRYTRYLYIFFDKAKNKIESLV